jgi:cystathionine beta-lyase/cystathionine gamma-synthase
MDRMTKLLHEFETPREYGDAVVPPVIASAYFASSSYEDLAKRYGEDGNADDNRNGNPTVDILEQKLASLEKGERCRCFASGPAAAVGAVNSQLKAGDHVICVKNIESAVYPLFAHYLPKFGVEVTFVDGSRVEHFERAMKPNTRLIYLQSPSAYLFGMQNLRDVAGLARHHGIITVIDNTWATPLLQNPIEHGIDLVVHSLTAYMSGHSDVTGGAVIGSADKLDRLAGAGGLAHGAEISPLQAWFVLRGLRTLPVRLRRHEQSAREIARLLEEHPSIAQVHYPGAADYRHKQLADRYLHGFSGMMSISLKGSKDQVRRFVDRLRIFRIGTGWGGCESAVLPPAAVRQPVWEEGVGEGRDWTDASGNLVRLSIGLEHVQDLKADLLDALEGAGNGPGGL